MTTSHISYQLVMDSYEAFHQGRPHTPWGELSAEGVEAWKHVAEFLYKRLYEEAKEANLTHECYCSNCDEGIPEPTYGTDEDDEYP